MTIAAVLQRQTTIQFLTKQDRDKSNQGSREPRCYLCGQTRHISKFCSLKRGNKVSPNTTALTQDTNQKVPLPLCPCFQNDYHWEKDCQSHFHRDGAPLPDASAFPAERTSSSSGKLGEGPAPVPSDSWSNSAIPDKRPLPQWRHIQQLQRASPGSAGLDLCTSSFKI